MRQRRRWINGSNFAQFYVLRHFCKFCKSQHGCCRKIWISIFYAYYLFNSLLAFIVVGMLYFTFSMVIRDFFSAKGYDFTIENPELVEYGNTPIVIILEVTYLVLLFQTMLLSLSVNLKSAKCQLNCISITYGFIMMFFLILAYFYFFFTVTARPDKNSVDVPSFSHRVLVALSVIIVILS